MLKPISDSFQIKDGVAQRTCESQRNSLDGKDRRHQHLGSSVGCLEVDLFAAAARNHAGKLQPHAKTAYGDQKTQNPEHERCAHAANTGDDGGRRREDTCTNDATDTTALS